jgi:hypothetical protein
MKIMKTHKIAQCNSYASAVEFVYREQTLNLYNGKILIDYLCGDYGGFWGRWDVFLLED